MRFIDLILLSKFILKFVDLYVEKMRCEAVRCISHSYRPTVPVAFVSHILGFTYPTSFKSNDEVDGIDDCEEWLRAHMVQLLSEIRLQENCSSMQR